MQRNLEAWQRHWFVVPDLAGPPTGGTRYNVNLLRALIEAGQDARCSELDEAMTLAARAPASCFWVDSLYLEAVPALRRLVAERGSLVGLLLHYLPTLVSHGAPLAWQQLGLAEQRALTQADAFIVTSGFMAQVLGALGIGGRRVLRLEPGRSLPVVTDEPAERRQLTACMIAHLLPGKGVLPFLNELGVATSSTDRFTLEIVGSRTLEPGYATECERTVRSHPELSLRVQLAGEVEANEALSKVAASDLLVSASVMESYGMAVADARTNAVPILAHCGGNVQNLVSVDAGGELVDSHRELAEAFLRLARDPDLVHQRGELARRRQWAPREWSSVARDFIALTKNP